MSNEQNLYVDYGIVRLYNGETIAIEQVQYSANGISHWEAVFNPYAHISTVDGVTHLGGHRYRRIRHVDSPEGEFQLPHLFVAEDGKSTELRVYNGWLQWRIVGTEEWTSLYELETLKGEKGDDGPIGQGLKIDMASTLSLRPAPCSGSIPTCNSCNPNSVSTATVPHLFLSIGNHKLTAASIDKYYHNGTAYVITTLADVGKIVQIWDATAANGTEALTMNEYGQVLLVTETPVYDSTGNIFICADGAWSLSSSIIANSGLVKMNVSDKLAYLDQKVDNVTIVANLANDLEVNDNSIDEHKLKTGTFGNGLNFVTGSQVVVDITDFNGFALNTTGNKLNVVVDDFNGDGLRVQGASPNDILGVNVLDLINNTSGLVAASQVDTFNDLKVNVGFGLEILTNFVKTKTDELSLVSDATNIRVKPYVGGNDGILPTHLNPTVANVNKGLLVNNTTGLEVKVDATTIRFDGTGALEITPDGITGDLLNDLAFDGTKGIKLTNDLVHLLVDDTSIGFNGTGKLEVKAGYLASILPANAVTSIQIGAAEIKGDVGISVDNTDPLIDLAIAFVGNTVAFVPSIDEIALTNFITGVLVTNGASSIGIKNIINEHILPGTGIVLTKTANALTIAADPVTGIPITGTIANYGNTGSVESGAAGTAGTYATADHLHSFTNGSIPQLKVVDLVSDLAAKVTIGTLYGSTAKITAENGIVLRAPNNTLFKLGVDNNGNLTTTTVNE